MGLTLGAYLTGVGALAAIALSLYVGAYALRLRLLPDWHGAPARLAEVVMSVAGLIWVSQVLGLFGFFEQWTLVAASVVVGAVVVIWAKPSGRGPGPDIHPPSVLGASAPAGGRGDPDPGHPRVEPSETGERVAQDTAAGVAHDAPQDSGSWLGSFPIQAVVAIAVAAVLFAEWGVASVNSLNGGMYGFDTQWYHMPFAVRFAQTGEVWPFHYTSPLFLSWFYPANSELVHAGGILAFGRDLLSPVLNMAWLGLALLAAWCLGRPWRVAGWTVLGVGVVLGAQVFADQAGDARNDVVALALILGSCALLATAASLAPGSIEKRALPVGPALGIAGLAAGLAVGTRLTALAPVLALSVGVLWLTIAEERRRAALLWFVPLLAGGGLWYLRNLVGSGNPLPWIDSLGPIPLPGPDQELGGREPFSVIHYATDFGVWADWFFTGLSDRLGVLWPVVLAAGIAGAALALWRGQGILRLFGAVSLVGGLAYLVTPVTAAGPEGTPLGFASNLRYLTAPLALGIALLPVVLRLNPVRFDGIERPWAGSAILGVLFVSVVADLDRWPWTYLHAGIAVGLAVAAVLALWAAVAFLRPVSPRMRMAADALPLTLLAIVVAVGQPTQTRYLEDRYENPAELLPNPGLDTLFRWARHVDDAKIGTTIQRQLPLYGTELSNHVQFIGERQSQAGFVRPPTCERWRRAVNGGRYDYVVTALDRIEPDGPTIPVEEDWIRADPNARKVRKDGPMTIWKLGGRLDPARCV